MRTFDRHAVMLLLFGAAMLIALTMSLPTGVFWITDCAARYLTTVNLVDKGFVDFSIDYPGRDLDPRFLAKPIWDYLSVIVDGRMYSYYPPLYPLLCAPFYAIFGFAGLYILPLVGALLTVWFAMKTGRLLGLSPWARFLSGLALLFCTPCFFYQFLNWEHCLANAAVMAALYLAIRRKGTYPDIALFAAGVILGLAVGLREEFLFIVIALVATLLLERSRRNRRLLFLPAGALGGLAPIWVFQYAAVGSPFGRHVSGNLSNSNLVTRMVSGDLLEDRFRVAWDLIGYTPDTPFGSLHAGQVIGLILVALASLLLGLSIAYLRRTKPRVLTVALVAASLSVLTLLHFLFTEVVFLTWFRGDGLLMHGALLIPGLASFTSRRPYPEIGKARILRRVILIFIVLFCLTAPPLVATGFHWGPRFFLPLFAPATLLTFRFFDQESKSGILVACLVLILLAGAATQFHAFGVLKRKLESSARISAFIASRPETVVITDIWWFPQDMAYRFYEKTFFLALNPEVEKPLLRSLAEDEVDGYLFVTFGRDDEDAIFRGKTLDPGLDVTVFARTVPKRKASR